MSDAHEVFGPLADAVNENTSADGIDFVAVFAALIDSLKQDPNMTIEMWEIFKLSVNNSAAICSNLVDEEIKRLQEA